MPGVDPGNLLGGGHLDLLAYKAKHESQAQITLMYIHPAIHGASYTGGYSV